MAYTFKFTPDSAVETALRHFREDVKAGVLKRLREEVEPELEQIATEVARSICDIAIHEYYDSSDFTRNLNVRFCINQQPYTPKRNED